MCMSCTHGGKEKLTPLVEDNLVEGDRRDSETPPTSQSRSSPLSAVWSVHHVRTTILATKLCLGACSRGLRDQKKDLDVLQKLGLKYDDTLPARNLFALLYERIPSTREICSFGDGVVRASEWSICGGADGNEAYRKARAANMGIKG